MPSQTICKQLRVGNKPSAEPNNFIMFYDLYTSGTAEYPYEWYMERAVSRAKIEGRGSHDR